VAFNITAIGDFDHAARPLVCVILKLHAALDGIGSHGGSKMWTQSAVQKPRKDGEGLHLGVAVFVVLPAVLAFVCSQWFPYGSPRFSSGLWFFYEASRDTAYLGIAVAAIFTVAAVIQQSVSRKIAVLMASSTVAAIFLLWYAIRRYPNPWQ
jgi:hypothetical protein